MKVSSVRVMTTRYLPDFSMRSRNASPNPNTRFFSASPPACVPLSMPPWPGPALDRKRLNETGAIHLLQLKHEPRRLTVGRLEHIGISDPGRAGQVKHD